VPAVTTAIALAYNVPGIPRLNLSAETLARIFTGAATAWNDPAIAADNPGTPLPPTPIVTVHRSDASASTMTFQMYLATAAPTSFPSGSTQWAGSGGQGASGSQALITAVKSTAGAIGYVEMPYALVDSLPVAKVGPPGHYEDPTTAAGAYPIIRVASEVVCHKGNNPQRLPLLKGFLAYAFSDTAQGELPELGYIPLPSASRQNALGIVAGLS